uniref:Uncharacterized protein n=2 Tax=Candidatus Bipolaricaulota TaxID=67810 RepID=H5SSB4_ACEAU|nr:hypothetical protein HGMM_OP3C205 [Candidatus Acetothermum autotrophicum]
MSVRRLGRAARRSDRWERRWSRRKGRVRRITDTEGSAKMADEFALSCFSVQLRSGETRRFLRRELGQLTVLRVEAQGVYAQIYLRSGQSLEGLLKTERVRARAWGQELELRLREVRQIVFRDETLRFGGGGQVQFCPEEPC